MAEIGRARPVEILLVEDSAADVRLTREAFKEAKVASNLHVARDGVEATAYLRQEGENAGAPRPDLVLLDLNLPRKDGRAVPAEVKDDPALREIPVIVLTTSGDAEDIHESYAHHANCYLTKPVAVEDFFRVIQRVDGFRLSVVRLPSEAGGEEAE